jgi:hypothetical protein
MSLPSAETRIGGVPVQLATRVFVCAAVLVVLIGGNQAASAHPRPAAKTLQRYGLAAYEWHPAGQLTTSQARQRLGYLRRNGFKTVYLDLGDYLDAADQPESEEQQDRIAELQHSLKRYVADASSFGLAVHAVGGGPTWTDERLRYLGPLLVELVADYNADAEADERLRGVNLDIEPYADPSFFDDEEASIDDYLQTIEDIVQTYRPLAARSANRKLQLGFAIPFWLDAGPEAPGPVSFNGTTKPAAFHIIDMIKDLRRAYLVVMSYRNFAKGIDGSIFHARKEFVYASLKRAKCGLVIGQQFTDVLPAKVTFHGRGRRAFDHAAKQIVRAFGHVAQFRGVSIDDLDAYMSAE